MGGAAFSNQTHQISLPAVGYSESHANDRFVDGVITFPVAAKLLVSVQRTVGGVVITTRSHLAQRTGGTAAAGNTIASELSIWTLV